MGEVHRERGGRCCFTPWDGEGGKGAERVREG